jgi:hypothetical protein
MAHVVPFLSAMWKRKRTPRASSTSGAAPPHLSWTAGSHPVILLPRPSNTPTVLMVLGKILNPPPLIIILGSPKSAFGDS